MNYMERIKKKIIEIDEKEKFKKELQGFKYCDRCRQYYDPSEHPITAGRGGYNFSYEDGTEITCTECYFKANDEFTESL